MAPRISCLDCGLESMSHNGELDESTPQCPLKVYIDEDALRIGKIRAEQERQFQQEEEDFGGG